MITVVIPTLNPQKRFRLCLSALIPAAMEGIVSKVIVVDGGSTDPFASKITEEAGAIFLSGERGRGNQLRLGAEHAKSRWLLFLHSDTVLEKGWEQEVTDFIRVLEAEERPDCAGVFRFALDDFGIMPRCLEGLVGLRCLLFRLPFGDQGLLVSKKLYTSIGGFKEIPLMEDVDIIRRLGRQRIIFFKKHAVTSAIRYKTDGYILRMLRNMSCLILYYLRVPPRYIERIYG